MIAMTTPKTVVLFHYDDFSKPHQDGKPVRKLPFTDMKGMIKRIETHSPGVNVIVPELFETIDF